MLNYQKLEGPMWLFLGAGIVTVAELHILLVGGEWNPFLALNMHFFMIYALVYEMPSYLLMPISFGILPMMYAASALAIQHGLAGRRWLLLLVASLVIASAVYFVIGFEYAMKWQGVGYYVISLLINAVGLGVSGFLAWRFGEGDRRVLLAVNLLIFILLGWCMFPWFGEGI